MSRRAKIVIAFAVGFIATAMAVFLLVFQQIQHQSMPHKYEIRLKGDRDFATDDITYDGNWIEFHDKWTEKTFRLPAQNIVIEKTEESLRK